MPRQAGAVIDEDIEITPEMVEAGYAVLAAACITEHLLDADKLTVEEIYRAMEAARPKPAPASNWPPLEYLIGDEKTS